MCPCVPAHVSLCAGACVPVCRHMCTSAQHPFGHVWPSRVGHDHAPGAAWLFAPTGYRERMAKKTEGNEEQRKQSGKSLGSSKQRDHEKDPSPPKQKTTHPVRD